jgi:hypothetical protein
LFKSLIIAFAAAFVILAGIFLALAMREPPKTDSAAKPEATIGSSFSDGFLKSFSPAFRDGCIKSAQAALTQRGVDLSTNGVGAKIETYCTCATDHAASDLTVPELMELRSNPASEPAATKMKEVIGKCQAEAGNIAQ